MNDKKTEIEEFLKIYELNEVYHERKERMAWIGSTVYYTFSLAILTWVAGSTDLQPTMLTMLVSVAFISALTFTSLQFSSRWDSVSKTGANNRILRRIQSEEVNFTLDEFYREDRLNHKGEWEKRKPWFMILLTFLLPIIMIFGVFPSKFLKILLWPRLRYLAKKVKKGGIIEYRKLRGVIRRCKTHQLIDSRYRTEIPTYTIATILFAAQLVLIWCPVVRDSFSAA